MQLKCYCMRLYEIIVGYQKESDNLRFDQNMVETWGAEFHKQDHKKMSYICPDPGATSLKQVHQLAALSSSQH